MLVLHIGLPKTATSFLQHKILAPAVRGHFLHRRSEGDGAAVCQLIKDYIRGRADNAERLDAIVELLRPHSGPETTIVTDEAISINFRNFWTGNAPPPDRVAARLGIIRDRLGPLFPEVRVLMGIRRQDSWLASRYAQSSKTQEGFTQEDFDRRATEIVQDGVHNTSLEGLDYNAVRSTFSAEFGPDRLYMFSMERLRDDPEQVLTEIGEFVGGLDLVVQRDRAIASGRPLVSNILSTGEDTWALGPEKKETLKLSPEIKAALIARFTASNEELGKQLDLRFD
jgi:hypothetical protein